MVMLKYIDILEKSLYNGLISGVGMDGKSFFYTNAMEIKTNNPYKHAEAERSGWFTCSCCPTNVTRLIPSVPGYLYAQRGNDVYVNLFATSTTQLAIGKKECPDRTGEQLSMGWKSSLHGFAGECVGFQSSDPYSRLGAE